MKKIIHHIRSKHPDQRDRYIWIIAAVAIGILIIIWMIVGNGRKTSPDENFFQNFDQGLEEGKNTFDENPLGQ
jgi:hypothetical protein